VRPPHADPSQETLDLYTVYTCESDRNDRDLLVDLNNSSSTESGNSSSAVVAAIWLSNIEVFSHTELDPTSYIVSVEISTSVQLVQTAQIPTRMWTGRETHFLGDRL